MSSDKKLRGKRPKKRRFGGNKYTKVSRIDPECALGSDEDSFEDNESLSSTPSTSSKAGATPTIPPPLSQVKLQNLYDVMKESDSSCSSEDESPEEDGEEEQDQFDMSV